MEQPEERPRPKLNVEIEVDTGEYIEGLKRFRSAMQVQLLRLDPDLEALDDELDILYRGQL
ncbi:hypothetical protein ACWELB_21245 [Streptomyces asiaticus]